MDSIFNERIFEFLKENLKVNIMLDSDYDYDSNDNVIRTYHVGGRISLLNPETGEEHVFWDR